MKTENLKSFLDRKVDQYNRPSFIKNDPVSIPHLFTRKEDIEIMGFWSSILAWGQRVTIINKCNELIKFMDNAPFDFIKNHEQSDLKKFENFKHRTFNSTDTLYFIEFFKNFYKTHKSLEYAFSQFLVPDSLTIEPALIGFHNLFFSLDYSPDRTRKHISSPAKNSSCKRLNMFLRWMVRKDDKGVDFGIWNNIKPSQLVCPCDVHVERVGRKLGLIQRAKPDWQTALELTHNLRALDPNDPVKYDFALFGLGVEGEM